MAICEGEWLRVSEALFTRVDDDCIGGVAGGQAGFQETWGVISGQWAGR